MAASVPRWPALVALLLVPPSFAEEPSTGWTEVQTEHITLKTDLSSDEARQAALTVERTRAALLAAAWPGAKLLQPERVEVVVLSSREDFQHYFGRLPTGVFLHADPPTAFLFGPSRTWERRVYRGLEESTSVLKHELSHHLAAYFFRREPRWFAEGLAQYLETLVISEDGKTATLGEINLEALRRYKLHRSLGVEDVLAWSGKLETRDDLTNNYLYGLSWLLVHWLNNTHPEEFARFQNLLIKGIDPDKAWKAVFGNLKSSDIDEQLKRYSQDGKLNLLVLPIPLVDGSVLVRPMSSADVHATRAMTALAGGLLQVNAAPKFVEALAELASALAEDPGNVRALRMKMGISKPEERLALGRKATEAHPNDGLAWLTLGEALPQTPDHWEERLTAYQKATTLLPDNATALNNLAWMYVLKGQSAEALPLAAKAVRLAPWNPAILDTYAAALAGVHRCSEAVAIEAQALDALPERTAPQKRAEYVAQLAELEKNCTEARVEDSPVGARPALERVR